MIPVLLHAEEAASNATGDINEMQEMMNHMMGGFGFGGMGFIGMLIPILFIILIIVVVFAAINYMRPTPPYRYDLETEREIARLRAEVEDLRERLRRAERRGKD